MNFPFPAHAGERWTRVRKHVTRINICGNRRSGRSANIVFTEATMLIFVTPKRKPAVVLGLGKIGTKTDVTEESRKAYRFPRKHWKENPSPIAKEVQLNAKGNITLETGRRR